MLVEVYRKWCVAVLFGAVLWGVSPSAGNDREKDPVLSFYRERARETFKSRDPIERGVSYSFRALTYYKVIGKKGEVTRIDSSIADYYFSFGGLDSSTVIVAPERKQPKPDFSFPNIFMTDYDYYFFPNDTGGASLAIGFDSFTATDEAPVGLALIDRIRYFLRRAYLFYPCWKGHKRFSRSFRFVECEGYVFPDSIWEVGARQAVFTADHYRIETGITNITIYR